MAKYTTRNPRRQKFTSKANMAYRFMNPLNPDERYFFSHQADYKQRIIKAILAGLQWLGEDDLKLIISKCKNKLKNNEVA